MVWYFSIVAESIAQHAAFDACIYVGLALLAVFAILLAAVDRQQQSVTPRRNHRTYFKSVRSMDQKMFTSIVLYMKRVMNEYGHKRVNMAPYVFSMDYVAYCTYDNEIIGLAFVRESSWCLKPQRMRDEKCGGSDTLYSNWLPITVPSDTVISCDTPNTFHTWNVRGLCVHEKYRQQGIATELMRIILEQARNRYIVHVELHVDKEPGRGCAWKVQFYQKMGFCALPERLEDYHLVWMNPVLL